LNAAVIGPAVRLALTVLDTLFDMSPNRGAA
jgi:hypothetical protein